MTKTILITGASGFIGSWLAVELVKSGHRVVGIDRKPPCDPQLWGAFYVGACEAVDLAGLFSREKVTSIFHLAGGAAVGASVADPYGDFARLLPGTARLATEAAKACPGVRLFLFSSAAVYGNPTELPISEATKVKPISPYGAHKAVAEHLLAYYAGMLDMSVTVLRIFSVYGPGLRKQLIWDICQKVKAAEVTGEECITLWGTGEESRDFIHVADICRAAALAHAHAAKSRFEIFNVATGVESTVRTIADELSGNLNRRLRIKFNGARNSGDPVNWRADVSLLTALGFQPAVDLKAGLAGVARWYRKEG